MNDTAKAKQVDVRCVLPESEDGYCYTHFMWVVDNSAVERGMMACETYDTDADVGFCCLDIPLNCQLDIPYACTVRSHGWLMVVWLLPGSKPQLALVSCHCTDPCRSTLVSLRWVYLITLRALA